MTVDNEYICHLRQLWQQSFGDSEETLDSFFSTAFSPERHASILKNGIPVSALYWFDCQLENHSLAYLYAVATDPAFRRQGYLRALLEETHKKLKSAGYSGVLLVPGEPELFALYEKFGYRTISTLRELTCSESGQPVALQKIDKDQYARLRRQLLPSGSVLQEKESLAFLQTYANFYAGRDFVVAATVKDNFLQVHEFLGDPAIAGDILHTLHTTSGQFRTPGNGRDFAMFLPLQESCPTPAYFGLAFD